MKKSMDTVMGVFACLLLLPAVCFATPTVTPGYGCTAVPGDNSTVQVNTAGAFWLSSTAMVVHILGYTPGTEKTITMTVSFLDPDIASTTYISMADDNATSGYMSAYSKTWRVSYPLLGFRVPLMKTWTAVRLTFTLNGGSGGIFTCGVRTVND